MNNCKFNNTQEKMKMDDLSIETHLFLTYLSLKNKAQTEFPFTQVKNRTWNFKFQLSKILLQCRFLQIWIWQMFSVKRHLPQTRWTIISVVHKNKVKSVWTSTSWMTRSKLLKTISPFQACLQFQTLMLEIRKAMESLFSELTREKEEKLLSSKHHFSFWIISWWI